MSDPQAAARTSDERLWAAIAHGSIILLGWGLIVPLLVWISQRQKSSFVAFQALQALVYQLLQMVYWLVLIVLVFCGMLAIILFGLLATQPTEPDAAAVALMIGVQFVPFLLIGCGWLLYLVPGVLGAVLVFLDKDFRYPVLGRWLESYLSPPAPGAEEPQ